MGTSTCHVMNGERVAEVPGMCGVVRDGITPGSWGYEAGQSGVGDIFGWFVEHGVPPRTTPRPSAGGVDLHEHLTRWPRSSRSVSTAWWRWTGTAATGRCWWTTSCPGVVVGLTLATRAEDVYRALLESTAFGTRRIIEAFQDAGVPVERARDRRRAAQEPFLMQVYADVTGCPLDVIDSSQGPALGAAIHAAIAAGAYDDIAAASGAMGKRLEDVYEPDPEQRRRYTRSTPTTSSCTTASVGDSELLHRLRDRRDAVL